MEILKIIKSPKIILVVSSIFLAIVVFNPWVLNAATIDVAAGSSGSPLGFTPSPVTISAGDTVRWTSGGSAPHTVRNGNSSGGTCQDTFDSGNLNNGQTFLHTFNTPGVCNYRCQIHFGLMNGVVDVGAAGIPESPSNLNAMVKGWGNATDWTTIDLSWTDNSSGEDGFRIERCVGSGCTAFSPLTTVGANVTTYSDAGLSSTTTFNYQIIAFNGAGDSSPSNASEATTGPDSSNPSQPGNVQGTPDPTICKITVTWDPSPDDIGIAGYNIYRDFNPTPIGTTPNTTFDDTGLSPATTYDYEVEAFDPAGNLSTKGASGPVTTASGCTTGGGGGGGAPAIVTWSTRDFVQTGQNITIGGFNIEGSEPKTVLVRAQGPSLADAGIAGPLANPFLRIYSGATLIAQNNDWGTTDPLCGPPAVSCGDATAIQATGQDPCSVGITGCTLESAVLITLPPGGYTAQMSGVGGGTGVGLISTWDMNTSAASKIIMVSTRGQVQTGNRIMIGGLTIGGTDPATVLIRGRGPYLGDPPFNLSGVLADPSLEVYSGATLIAQNDNWQTTDPLCGSPAIFCGTDTEITSLNLDPCQPNPGETSPPTNCDLESAILITLPPGTYSIFHKGASGETGMGLVDVTEIPPTKLENISTRARVETGPRVMIGGFIIDGTEPKTVLIRAQGPSLVDFGVSGVLANPTMQLFSGSTLIAQNNDWQTTDPLCLSPAVTCGDDQDIIGTGLDPCTAATTGCTLDSAIYVTLPPGAYTAIVQGVGGGTGIGLIGIFDPIPTSSSKLSNISTRSVVRTGANVMIGGFIISGTLPKTVLIRAQGPSLVDFGVTGVLANPTMQFFSGSTVIAQNNDWQTTDPLCSAPIISCGDDQDIIATGLDPCTAATTGCSLDSALYVTLPPGAYTAIISGVGGGQGVALGGVFDLY